MPYLKSALYIKPNTIKISKEKIKKGSECKIINPEYQKATNNLSRKVGQTLWILSPLKLMNFIFC